MLLPWRQPAEIVEDRQTIALRLSVVLRELVVPFLLALCVLGVIEAVLRSAPILSLLDRYRPPYVQPNGLVDMRLHVEKQLLHLEALRRNEGTLPTAVFIGSSSVVNGVDERAISESLSSAKQPMRALNMGLTGFLAAELGALQSYFLTPKSQVVVYLYNGFSFADVANPDAVDARGNVLVDAVDDTLTGKDQGSATRLVERFISEELWTRRYRTVLVNFFDRLVAGSIRPLPSPFDYDAARPPPPPEQRQRIPQTPLSEDIWVRKAYRESVEREATRGYVWLERFCRTVQASGRRFVASPVPEPIFGRYAPAAVGMDFGAIDKKVQAILSRCGGSYVARDEFRDFEDTDENFVDSVHMSAGGRRAFSQWWADRLQGKP